MGQKITIREAADLGPVLARADHQDNVIEVNAKAFYQLPPLVQEFILCHEVCHLKHNEWDEARTNQLAAELFLQRAKNDDDREARQRFLSYIDGQGGYSNWVAAVVSAAVSLGTMIYGIVANRNAMWYSWDDASKQANLNTMLKYAFEQSRRSSSKSAADFFWEQMRSYTNKDDSLDQFLGRSANEWVQPVITKYEQSYGFGFREVTPVDLTAYPVVIVAIGALIGFIIYRIIKKRKK